MVVCSFFVGNFGARLMSYPTLEGLNTCPVSVDKLFLQIETVNKILNIGEVEVFDFTNNNVAKSKPAALTTSHSLYPARNCVDGNVNTFCSSNDVNRNERLTIELGSINVKDLSRVVITNRADCCQDRLQGASIKLTLDKAGRYVAYEWKYLTDPDGCNYLFPQVFLIGNIE